MGKPLTFVTVTLSRHGVLRYKAAVARVLFIENHDSFSWNVIDALPFSRNEIHVVTAREALTALDQVDVVVMGPGPTDPVRAGLVEVVREVARRRLPFLGVCLGHQALGLAFGASLIRSPPAHGKRAVAHFSGATRFEAGAMDVMRYHSLSLVDVKSPLRVVGSLADGTVMAVEHESLPMAGVQFHPDSFGTPRGRELLARYFNITPLSLSPLSTSLPLPAGIPSQNIGDMLGRVLSGSKHGVRQTRGKFGLGAKMVIVRSTLICDDFDDDDCDDFDEGE